MKILRNLILISLVFLVWSCAQILAPTGGPLDLEPPTLVSSSPAQRSTNVSDHIFRLDFNEFFSLQNPTNNILISPPLNQTPEYKIKGKSLYVSIKDTLQKQTTYSFNFTDCIRDITENNTIKSFVYVFSTDSYIDSNSIKGKVINAETLLPEKDISVLLYKSETDTLPFTEKPFYLTKTNEAGGFEFLFLSGGSYSIYALMDKNNNMIFDPSNEAFAFSNQMVESKPLAEILEKDMVSLNLFVHQDTVQRINRTYSNTKGIQTLVFKNPSTTTEFSVINENISSKRFYYEFNATRDTVQMYDLEISTDTILMQISENDFIDTIRFVSQQESTRRGGKRGSEEINRLKWQLYNAEHVFMHTFIEFSYPVKEILKSNFYVIKDETDTLLGNLILNDSLPRRVTVNFEKKSNSKYSISIPDSVVIGYNGFFNDTINQQITVREEADYGHFSAKIMYTKNVPIIVQLLNEQGKLIDTSIISSSEVLVFRNKLPQNYRMTFIFDINHNGKWDTGNFFVRRQPEPKYIFEKSFSVKANWDIEETINLDDVFLKLKIDQYGK